MNEKSKFRISAIAATVISVAFGYILFADALKLRTGTASLPPSISDHAAIFGLWISIVVGVFTVWGLWWAASAFAESAVKPEICLLPGKGKAPYIFPGVGKLPPMKAPPFRMPGHNTKPVQGEVPMRAPHLLFDLYLINKKSRAGRYICVVIRVLAASQPSYCRLLGGPKPGSAEGEKDPHTGHITVARQCPEEFVVYQSPAYVGELTIEWNPSVPDESLPMKVVLDYDIYTLDGASKGSVELDVEWGADA